MMPSPYTADISWIDARDMARAWACATTRSPSRPSSRPSRPRWRRVRRPAEDTTEENIQARIRGTLLMALSNKFGWIVLTTGNKSEMATGYCTLYGDMAGGFAVIKDVAKTTVFRLARWRNAHDPYGTGAGPIPERIITARPAPSCAPTRPTRTACRPTRCSTPSSRYMENDQHREIVAEGFARPTSSA
jgi:NAD+ synthase (glutamine-hydrolysing)